MPSILSFYAFLLLLVLCQSGIGRSEQTVVAGVTITSPPIFQPSAFADLVRRNSSLACSYGMCVSSCLSQGAFCCNPGGTLVPPNWVCDNGACITSVRGDTGIVDCYDPDNPSGTTQSCVDYKGTVGCASTDKCYTCESTQPYCHWQTWIATNAPTLRWFSCVTDKQGDATFLAATLTGTTSPATSTASASTLPTSTAPSPTSPSPFPSPTTSTSPPTTTALTLSTPTITGIALGGGILLLIILALTICLLRRRRSPKSFPPSSYSQTTPPRLPRLPPTAELDSPMFYPDTSSPGYIASPGSPPRSAYREEQWRWRSVDGSVGFGGGMQEGTEGRGERGVDPWRDRRMEMERMEGIPPPPAELPVQSREAERILGMRGRHQLG